MQYVKCLAQGLALKWKELFFTSLESVKEHLVFTFLRKEWRPHWEKDLPYTLTANGRT